MYIIAVGVNHKTAPVDIREKLAYNPDELNQATVSLLTLCSENFIVSTCNRTEIYLASKNETPNLDYKLLNWLSQSRYIPVEKLRKYSYTYHNKDAVQHLLRVVCGLDSMVLGEPQILGQVKNAHQQALNCQSTGTILNRLAQFSFSAAKKIRTQTAIGANPVSVAYAAVRLAKQIFSDLSQQTVLLVGAGETIELACRHLNSHAIGKIIVANRSVANARKLADEFAGKAITLEQISHYLPQADIIISSTAAPIPIIGKGSVERALKARRYQPMFMVDIAVPRDIEPEVSQLDDVYLYTVDDLQSVIEENMESRQIAAQQAEQMVGDEIIHFMGWLRAQGQLQLLRDFRERAEIYRQASLEKAKKLLRNGKSVDDTLEFLAHTLTNKLSHEPTAALNKAAHRGDMELLDAAKEILNLKDNLKT
ncbi:MAG TPA: glutamyl-tRNA reductase [Thiotrichaceae bacterium]|nr:glutamyl-tRNA reductase [Thiotrichaceae bacterium]